jgi:rhodanese-related sulfurtransferase
MRPRIPNAGPDGEDLLNFTERPNVTVERSFLLFASVGSIALTACQGGGPAPRDLTVYQLSDLLKAESPPKIFDANGESTREEYGVIPGAVLLPSSSSYPLELLPTSKAETLVFYCASSWCGAADCAARRAIRAGYASVNVLPEGIKGWAGAGLPTGRAN